MKRKTKEIIVDKELSAKCNDCDNPASHILKLEPQFPNIVICKKCNEKHYKSDAIKQL